MALNTEKFIFKIKSVKEKGKNEKRPKSPKKEQRKVLK
jgi:hypothetical protein